MFYPLVSLYIMCMHGAHRGDKSPSDPLELEVEMVVSAMWVLRIEVRSSGRTTSVVNL